MRSHPWAIALLLAMIVALVPARQTQASPSTPDSQSGPHLLASDAHRVIFDLVIPLPAITQSNLGDRSFQRLALPGYSAGGQPGQPELPEAGVVIAVPPAADVAVRIVAQQTEDLPGSYVIYPVPESTVVLDPTTGQPDLAAGVQSVFIQDAAAYAMDEFVPADTVAVSETAFIRQQRVARIAIRPVQYNPALGALRVSRYLRVEVTFDCPAGCTQVVTQHPAMAAATDDVFEPLLRQQVLNYEQGKAWRSPRQAAMQPEAVAPIAQSGEDARPWLKLSVREEGLYRVTRDDIEATGLAPTDAQMDPANWQLYKGGQQMAMDFLGDGDEVFEAGEALVFYAPEQRSIYSRDTVYWLTVGDEPGLRMAAADGSPRGVPADAGWPAILRLEEDRIYRQDLPKDESITDARWYWQELFSLDETSAIMHLSLPDALTSGYLAQLRVRLVGVTYLSANPDHQVRWYVNGQAIGDVVWDGATAISATLEFPATWLESGENTIEASLPMTLPGVGQDRVYLDWIELSHQRTGRRVQDGITFAAAGAGAHDFVLEGFYGADIIAYDVTEPAAPQRLLDVQITGASSQDGTQTAPAARRAAAISAVASVFLPVVSVNAEPSQVSVRLGVDVDGEHGKTLAVTRVERLRSVWQIDVDRGSAWRSPDHQADYLLIAHRNLWDAAQTLAEHRRSRGLTVAVIDVQDIYDEFSDGRVDPRALRDFVAYAYHQWQAPAPAYVLLLGDGHYDYRMTSGLATRPGLIPPYLDCYDPWLCEVASDNAFATVSGDDRLPDLAIGRLPAPDLARAQSMVEKVIAYETHAELAQQANGSVPADDWRRSLVFVADNGRDASGRPDSAGNFERYTESTIAMLPESLTVNRVYYDPYPADDASEVFRQRTPAAVTAALLAAVNAGQLFVNYIGHAAINVWGHEWFLVGNSSIRNDVLHMTNVAQLPIFLDMACLSGNFADVLREALEETLLAHPGGGSVAGWGATGFGVASGHDQLHAGFYQAIFEAGVTELGLATVAGKQHLWQEEGNRHIDLLDTFGLLGDPALRISLPGN